MNCSACSTRMARDKTCAQIAETRVQPQQLAALVRMVDARQINANTGKKVLESMYRSGDDPQTVVEREGLAMVQQYVGHRRGCAGCLRQQPGRVGPLPQRREKAVRLLHGPDDAGDQGQGGSAGGASAAAGNVGRVTPVASGRWFVTGQRPRNRMHCIDPFLVCPELMKSAATKPKRKNGMP